uniref:Uncharacterized protein n=1 Tax=Arundo donax TaxID=35708 RepID=A0A0A9H5Q3_ARUDO
MWKSQFTFRKHYMRFITCSIRFQHFENDCIL